MIRSKNKLKGFTLVEAVVAIAIAGILIGGVIQLYSVLVKAVKAGREQTVLAALTSNYLEIVRNLPFSEIGTAFGNPNGNLPDQNDPIEVTIENKLYRIYYEVTWIDDPADGTILAGTDVAADDYKQVKMNILNTATSVVKSFVTSIVPKGLEGTDNAGALVLNVIDASGQPVAGASVHIENTAGTIILDRTTDANGNWIEVSLPPGVNSYHIVVTKAGYSTDSTYPLTVDNPNPTKPDSTINVGVITSVSFAIDLLSNLTIRTLNSTCGNLSNVEVNLAGAKLIGTSPDVTKFNQNFTSASGAINLLNTEWDVYVPTLLTDQGLMILGTSPIQQISVLPGASQTYSMILGPTTDHSLLVIVKDSASTTALEGATVRLTKASPAVDLSAVTGGSVWTQNDWSGGSGQADFTNTTRYFSDDGNVDVSTLPTGVRLAEIAGNYLPSARLVSSTFDTGGASNYTTLTWQPASQHPDTTIRFQIASNNDNATWNFVGPDGTNGTYYTVAGTNIATAHDNERYVRYQVFLDTTDDEQTPVLSNLSINYVAGCFTPGQVSFPNLTAGNDYTIEVSMPGYTTQTLNSVNISGNQTAEILLSP